MKRYIAALDADDGATLCRIFAPGAFKGVKLPVHRGTCAATLTASVGHRGAPGAPRWLSTQLVDADTVVLVRGGDGRFTGTVVHKLAGREPSIEDDVDLPAQRGRRQLADRQAQRELLPCDRRPRRPRHGADAAALSGASAALSGRPGGSGPSDCRPPGAAG